MQIEIHSRHFNLGDEQKDKFEELIQKLERYSPRPPLSARVNITNEKGRFTADLVVFLKSSDFRTRVEASEPEIAFDEAIANIRTQLQRYKGKISSRHKSSEGGLGRALSGSGEGLLSTEGSTLQAEGFRLKDLSVDNAVEIFRDSEHPFFVFRNNDNAKVSVVYRRDDGDYGLLETLDD